MRANRAALAAREKQEHALRRMVLQALIEAVSKHDPKEPPKPPAYDADAEGFPKSFPDELKTMLRDMGLARDMPQAAGEDKPAEPPEAANDEPEARMGADGFPAGLDKAIKAKLRALGFKPGEREQTIVVDGDADDATVQEIMDTLKAAGANFKAEVFKVGGNGDLFERIDEGKLPADLPEPFRKALIEAAKRRGKTVSAADARDNACWTLLINEVPPDQPEAPTETVMVKMRAPEGLANDFHATLDRLKAPAAAHAGHGFADVREPADLHAHEGSETCDGCHLHDLFRRLLVEGDLVQREVVVPAGEGQWEPATPVAVH